MYYTTSSNNIQCNILFFFKLILTFITNNYPFSSLLLLLFLLLLFFLLPLILLISPSCSSQLQNYFLFFSLTPRFPPWWTAMGRLSSALWSTTHAAYTRSGNPPLALPQLLPLINHHHLLLLHLLLPFLRLPAMLTL